MRTNKKKKKRKRNGTIPVLPRQESSTSSVPVHDCPAVAIEVTPNVGASATAVPSLSTAILRNVKGWWDTRKKPEGNVRAGGDEIGEEEMPRSLSTPNRAGPVDAEAEDISMAMSAHESEDKTADKMALPSSSMALPSSSTVKTFAQQIKDRAREQQKSHSEYVAWLCENRQKARPVTTAKSYERVRRWWMVHSTSSI